MNDPKVNKLILKCAYIIIIVLIIAVIALLILKYDVEGEKNMPFKLSSILVISSAEGYQEKENNNYKWDAEIYQNNDIYLNIEKNKNYRETEIIKSIKIDNVKVNKEPIVGNINFYRVSNQKNTIFSYNEEFKITDEVEYLGDINTSLPDLKISNQGGTILIRIVNKTGKRYVSNEKEFEHNGRLLSKVSISNEDVKAKVSFDVVITLESELSFRTNIELEIPVNDITKEGSSSIEIEDMKEIVFKREQK